MFEEEFSFHAGSIPRAPISSTSLTILPLFFLLLLVSSFVVMFCAMTCALPAYAISSCFQNDKGKGKTTVQLKVLIWLLLPAIFDLAGTNFAQIGLVHTTVSCYQLLRCSVIIVTAILKAFVLKYHLKPYMWAGVVINIVAVVSSGGLVVAVFACVISCSIE